ncbi:MAG: glyoxylate/hydroxypyruvate reductase A [Paracoccaceae bacterium]
MPLNILFSAPGDDRDRYESPLLRAFKTHKLDVNLQMELDPAEVDYIVYAPSSTLKDFKPYTRTKAVLNLWAGVEAIVGNATLTQPLTRMVDHGLSQGMTEWVVGHTLRHHLGMDTHIMGQDGQWRLGAPPLSHNRRVTILGIGELGIAVGQALCALGFPVTGWSRSAKTVEGITCRHGRDGLRDALSTADICVLLLPNTPATENTLNTETLAWMPRGAFVLNPGRGSLIDDDALLAELDSGHIAHATLDVFRVEPLPLDHPYWTHPSVTVTPHIAAETRAETGAEVIAENVRRSEAGEALLHVVDRSLGY